MAEPSKLELMLEAERRGILPEDKAALLAEARSRGLVPGSSGQSTQADYAIESKYGGSTEEPGMLSKIAENPIVQGAGNLAKTSAIPTAMGLGGAYIGSFAGPIGTIVGESIGSGAGEGVNQLAGITPPSAMQIILSAGAGPVTRGVIGAARIGVGAATRAIGGRQLFADVASEVANQILKPPKSSDILFKEAANVDHFLSTPRTAKAIETALTKEVQKLGTPTSKAIKESLAQYAPYFSNDGGAVTMQHASNLADAAADLRIAASAAYKDPKLGSRMGHMLSDIRNAIFDDAEASGIPVFREAAKASRREHAINELQSVLRSPHPMKAFEDLADKNALFKTSFNASEQEQIKKILTKMETVTPSGFSGVAGRALAGVAGTAVAGPIGIAAFAAPDVAAWALSRPSGRKYIEKLLGDRNVFDAPKAAALAIWARGAMAEEARTSNTVKEALKEPRLSIETKIKAAMGEAQSGGAAAILQSR